MSDQVILVDEQDNEQGSEEKLKAHQEAKLHRAFSVFLVCQNTSGEWMTLLQQRQQDKYHCGGLWTNSCCSHPRPGETVIEAGLRRCQEELGAEVSLTQLDSFIYKAVFENGLCEYEYDHVLLGQVSLDLSLQLNAEEVMATQWVSFAELFDEYQLKPNNYTPWVMQAAKIVYAHLKGN